MSRIDRMYGGGVLSIFKCEHLQMAQPVMECMVCVNTVLCSGLKAMDQWLQCKKREGKQNTIHIKQAVSAMKGFILPLLPSIPHRRILMVLRSNIYKVEFGQWTLLGDFIYLFSLPLPKKMALSSSISRTP